MTEQIVILDYGSQYTQVIARRIRECNVYSTILPYNNSRYPLTYTRGHIANLKHSPVMVTVCINETGC